MLLTLLLVATADACGPFLAHALVLDPPAAIWEAPVADFAVEVAPLLPDVPAGAAYREPIDVELQALTALGVAAVDYRPWRWGRDADFVWPAGAAPGLRLYAEGARRWRLADVAGAELAWRALLTLPEDQRREQTVQARFMLAASVADFEAVRALVAAGWPDPLGLATICLGEAAQVLMFQGDDRGAADLYLQQAAEGNDGAITSLAMLSRSAAEGGRLAAWAADPVLRRLMSAWVLSRGGPDPEPGEVSRTRQWLGLLTAEGAPIDSADRLAWMAWQLGDIDATTAWLALATDTPLAHWLRGKVLLRAGDVAAAEAELALAGAAFPAQAHWEEGALPHVGTDLYPARAAWGDAGVLRLALQDYPGAFDAFSRAGSWVDAAYVAERLLPLEQAMSLVGPAAPLPPRLLIDNGWGRPWPEDPPEAGAPSVFSAAMRYLLARRQLRTTGVADLAAFPDALLDDVERWTRAVADRDSAWTDEGRAEATWRLARLTRTRGMELVGTELEPDFSVYAGDFQDEPSRSARFAVTGQALQASPDEAARWRASAPDPDARWHYRSRAADLALEAAALLDPTKGPAAQTTCFAMRWEGSLDPDAPARIAADFVHRIHRWPPTDCGAPLLRTDNEVLARRGLWVGVVIAAALALGMAWRRRASSARMGSVHAR